MEKEFPEEGEIVLCTVGKIMGTTIFAKLDDYGKEGVIATSEVSPGRIHNIRDFVVPNKKIVCKVLRVNPEKSNIDLSLRRVTQKESREVLERYKKEKDSSFILEKVIPDKEKLQNLIKKIKEEHGLISDFLQLLKENHSLINKYGLGEKESSELQKIITERVKSRKVEIKMKVNIICRHDSKDSISAIKEIFDLNEPKAKVTYISASNYLVSVTANDYKEANRIMDSIIVKINKRLKEKGGFLENEIKKVP